MTLEELLQTVPAEVKAAIEQIEDKAGTSDADWQFIKAAGELLAAAKAASVVPVRVVYYESDYDQTVKVALWSNADAQRFADWLRDRMKERGNQ